MGMNSHSKRDNQVKKAKPGKEDQLKNKSHHLKKEVAEMTLKLKT